jgi:hypothetical protein
MPDKNPSTIYVVFGMCGEYSDRREWPVCAFLQETLAADLVVKLTSVANDVCPRRWEDDKYTGDYALEALRAAGDPNADIYSNEPTRYSYAPLELRG